MAEETKSRAPLSLGRGKLELKKTVEKGQVKQSFSHGRTKVVQVERKRKRSFEVGADGKMKEVAKTAAPTPDAPAPEPKEAEDALSHLTEEERAHRMKVLQDAQKASEDVQRKAEEESAARAARQEAERQAQEEKAKVEAELKAKEEKEAEEERLKAEEEAQRAAKAAEQGNKAKAAPATTTPAPRREDEDDKKKKGKAPAKQPTRSREPKRREGKLTISSALANEDRTERVRSDAAFKRAQEKEKRKAQEAQARQMTTEKIVREVTVPETITVQDLANRMAEQGGQVIKTLMQLGVMATINDVIDADTAELVIQEFGHSIKRVSEADVEEGLAGAEDDPDTLEHRPPVVTVMGHVDHGKTSLLDAIRSADVVSGEAGGITQHIGAYQVRNKKDQKITFIDTPGHEAFTAMRARGAQVTDIVILVVAADDGLMPQTLEAIKHAKAAEVPMIVAINKMDKPDADPQRVKTDLLSQEVIVEDMSGDVQAVEVSATEKTNLDKLEEAILLQAELMELGANPERAAEGAIIEAKMERGKGSVGTVLVQRGTLKVGDIFVAGAEWGKVRALVNDQGKQVKSAGPSTPVEVLGFNGTPSAGDDFVVVADEARAREITEYRGRKEKDSSVTAKSTTMEQMFEQIQAGENTELPVVIKADVQGSVEALVGTLEKLGTDTAKINVLHGAVGPVNESDVTLAAASNAVIIGFNVRANSQAREHAKRDGVDIRYYSIIYDVSDDLKKLLSGMMAPDIKENFIGYAEIREVFNVSKVGRVAGCMVTEGVIKRGCGVRLLRDDTVIHEGELSQLKRFKDDVKEVTHGYECGMAFANYQDIQQGDMVECFETEEVAVEL